MTNRSQTLLVTGGAGFIGTNFIHYWLKNHPDDYIINLDSLTYAGNLANLQDIASNNHYRFVHQDIRNSKTVNELMSEVDVVVHFAAESHVDRSIKNPALFLETNILGTQVLLDAAVKHQLKHFHHISTDEVFGSLDLGSKEKFSESTAYNPRSPYSASKAGSDHLVRAYGETYRLPYTISNCSNNYGPYQFPEKLFSLAITNLIEHKPIPLYGDGLNMRDWLYVEDHCRAIDLILSSGAKNETYLIGGLTQDISNFEICHLILELMDADESMLKIVPDRPGHDRRYAVNWSKINHQLGWEPTVTLKEGLTKTISWYQNNPDWWQPLKIRAQDWYRQQYSKLQP